MNISEIFDIINWGNPIEVQQEGIKIAAEIKEDWMFVQPLTPEFNKPVWDNCAIILSNKTDDELMPYFIPLLEWLQDLNWPGAITILKRIKIVETQNIIKPYSYCVAKAMEQEDYIWIENLAQIMKENKLSKLLLQDIKLCIEKYI